MEYTTIKHAGTIYSTTIIISEECPQIPNDLKEWQDKSYVIPVSYTTAFDDFKRQWITTITHK